MAWSKQLTWTVRWSEQGLKERERVSELCRPQGVGSIADRFIVPLPSPDLVMVKLAPAPVASRWKGADN